MPDFSKRYNQNEIETEMDAQRAALGGIRISKISRPRIVPRRSVVNKAKLNTFETEYQNFIKKLKEQKAQEQAQETVIETIEVPAEKPVVEAPKPKKKKSKVVLDNVITETQEETEVAITEKVEEQPELPMFDLD